MLIIHEILRDRVGYANDKEKYMAPTKIGVFSLLLFLAGIVSVNAEPTRVQETRDLHRDAQEARAKNIPILVMFSQHGCAYCVILEEEYLKPMVKSGDYRNKVLIRKVMRDNYGDIRNFDGKAIAADKLANDYRAFVSPTLVFVDHNGKELAKRIMGVGTEGYFAYELDQSIELSLRRLRAAVALNR